MQCPCLRDEKIFGGWVNVAMPVRLTVLSSKKGQPIARWQAIGCVLGAQRHPQSFHAKQSDRAFATLLKRLFASLGESQLFVLVGASVSALDSLLPLPKLNKPQHIAGAVQF